MWGLGPAVRERQGQGSLMSVSDRCRTRCAVCLSSQGAALKGLVCRPERSCRLTEARHVLGTAGSLSLWLNMEVAQSPRCGGAAGPARPSSGPQGCPPHLHRVCALSASARPSLKGLMKAYWDWLPPWASLWVLLEYLSPCGPVQVTLSKGEDTGVSGARVCLRG